MVAAMGSREFRPLRSQLRTVLAQLVSQFQHGSGSAFIQARVCSVKKLIAAFKIEWSRFHWVALRIGEPAEPGVSTIFGSLVLFSRMAA